MAESGENLVGYSGVFWGTAYPPPTAGFGPTESSIKDPGVNTYKYLQIPKKYSQILTNTTKYL